MNSASGSVRRRLRFEGAAAVAASLVFYRYEHASWVVFAVLFLAPDLAMLGYLAGSRVGAAAHNLVHNYVLPLLLLMAAVLTARPMVAAYALIWTAHIGFDRLLGYGLKYPSAFGETHLGRIGRRKTAEHVERLV